MTDLYLQAMDAMHAVGAQHESDAAVPTATSDNSALLMPLNTVSLLLHVQAAAAFT